MPQEGREVGAAAALETVKAPPDDHQHDQSTPSQVILSWSGGKDSTMTLYALMQDPAYKVVALLVNITKEYDRISVHGVRRALLEAQADSCGLPIIEVTLQPACSNISYEACVNDGLARAKARFPEVKHLAFGDLFLEDVRAYREKSLEGSGFKPIFPIWGQDTSALAQRVVDEGFKSQLVCVDNTQLDGQAFAGRLYDHALLADLLIAKVDLCGENGEFHTFAWDGPIFKYPIRFTVGENTLRDDRFVFCDLIPSSAEGRKDEGAGTGGEKVR